jgi:hypothetical protein
MPDIVNEIFAGEITASSIAATGSVTLATTNSTTQYVVKDVSIEGTIADGNIPSLYVNAHKVAEVDRSVTGSEIVDFNSTLKYQAYDTAPTFTQQLGTLFTAENAANNIGTYTNYINDNKLLINNQAASNTGTEPVIIASNLSSNNNRLHQFSVANDGSVFYVFWDGNSQTLLYKRTGGINGLETTIFTGSYGWIVFDKIDSYYYANNGAQNYTKYNINTNTTTTSPNFGFLLSTTSYPNASLINNGNIILNPSGDGQPTYVYILNPTTNVAVQVNLPSNVVLSGTSAKLSAHFNAATNRYTIYKRINSNLYKYALTNALTTSTYSSGYTSTQYSLPTHFGHLQDLNNTAYTVVDDVNYSVARHQNPAANTTDMHTLNTLTNAVTITPFLNRRTLSDSVIVPISTNTIPASAITRKVKVRVTGVKTTL